MYNNKCIINGSIINKYKYICQLIAEMDDLELLKFVRKYNFSWDDNTGYAAAKNGNFEMVKWICYNNCPTDMICSGAAEGGHIDILIWGHKKKYSLGSNICINVSINAIKGGHYDILLWAYDNTYNNRCIWNTENYSTSAEIYYNSCLKKLESIKYEYELENNDEDDFFTDNYSEYCTKDNCIEYRRESNKAENLLNIINFLSTLL